MLKQFRLLPIKANYSLVFNEICQLVKSTEEFFPIILFNDIDNNACYYVLARFFYNKDGSTKRLKHGEIIVDIIPDKHFLKTETAYITNLTRIFRIDCKYLESLIDHNHKFYRRVHKLDDFSLECMEKNILIVKQLKDTNFSLIQINPNQDNQPTAHSLYLSDKKIKQNQSLIIRANLNASDFQITPEKIKHFQKFYWLFINTFFTDELLEVLKWCDFPDVFLN